MMLLSFRLLSHLLGLSVLILALVLPAQAVEISEAKAEFILDKLRGVRPDFNYGEVKHSPISGVYQVQIKNGPLLYVAADGKHLISGDLYAIENGQFVDLEEKLIRGKRTALLATIALDDMIIFPATGERKTVVNIFTDVDCSYCRKLHWEVPKLNAAGVEVRYLAYPRAGIGSASYRKIASAWCADDKRDALTRIKSNESLAIKVCADNPVAAQFSLGSAMGVSGTPALVLADGTLIPGYRPAADLLKMMGL